MTQVMATENLEFDASVWPADAFPGPEEEEGEENPEKGEDDEEEQSEDLETAREPDWQEEQKNKLKNIISRRRTVVDVPLDPEVIKRGITSNSKERAKDGTERRERKGKSMRKSRSFEVEDKPPSKDAPLRRAKTRESVSPVPRRLRERSPKDHTSSPRSSRSRDHSGQRERTSRGKSSPRASRSARTKKPSPRSKSMDPDAQRFLDESNGSMEFDNVKDPRSRDRRGSTNHNSAPRLVMNKESPRAASSREEQINARRQKMMKRKHSLRAGSLRRLMVEAESTPKAPGDEISIDDTVDIMDDSDEHKVAVASKSHRRGQRVEEGTKSRRHRSTSPHTARDTGEHHTTKSSRRVHGSSGDEDKEHTSKSRRGHHSSIHAGDEEKAHTSKSRRAHRTSGDEAKTHSKIHRRGSKRDLLRKSLSDKPDRSGTNTRRRRSMMDNANYKSNSFKIHHTVQRMKELGEQHQKVRQKMQSEEEEMTLEELVVPNSKLRKSRSIEPENRKIKSGIENLANLSISRNHASRGHNSFDGSWNVLAANASGDLKENPKAKTRNR